MTPEEIREFAETLHAKAELKMRERILTAEQSAQSKVRDLESKLVAFKEKADDKVETLESKLDQMRQIAFVLGAVALIFGASGAWGLKMLNGARETLGTLGKKVETLSTQVAGWENLRNEYTRQLEDASASALGSLTEKARAASRCRRQFYGRG